MSVLSMLKLKSAPSDQERLLHERLSSAKAARAAAHQDVIDARATLERLRVVVDKADDAAKAAADATQKANEARRDWVKDGCLRNARAHQELSDLAAELARAAELAAKDANVARPEYARAQERAQSLQIDLQGRERAIRVARDAIIVAEMKQELEELVQAADVYRAKRAKAQCLLDFLKPEDRYDTSQDANRSLVYDALERARIVDFDKEREGPRARDWLDKTNNEGKWIDSMMAPLRARAEELLRDEPN
jgi:hypothetical protein